MSKHGTAVHNIMREDLTDLESCHSGSYFIFHCDQECALVHDDNDAALCCGKSWARFDFFAGYTWAFHFKTNSNEWKVKLGLLKEQTETK